MFWTTDIRMLWSIDMSWLPPVMESDFYWGIQSDSKQTTTYYTHPDFLIPRITDRVSKQIEKVVSLWIFLRTAPGVSWHTDISSSKRNNPTRIDMSRYLSLLVLLSQTPWDTFIETYDPIKTNISNRFNQLQIRKWEIYLFDHSVPHSLYAANRTITANKHLSWWSGLIRK